MSGEGREGESVTTRPAWTLLLVFILLLSNGVWLWVTSDQAATFRAWTAELGARRRAVEVLSTSLEAELRGRDRAAVLAHNTTAHPDATPIQHPDRIALGDVVFHFDEQDRLVRVDHTLATAKRD